MEIRLNKYLSELGVCSRRAADEYIQNGKVLVNDEKAVMGMKVSQEDMIEFCGKRIDNTMPQRVVLAFNKPVGIVCTASSEDKDNIVDYIGYPERIYPVGRLDKESEGLILLTNDGEMTNQILKVSNDHEKEYVVTVNKPVTEKFIKGMAAGVNVLGKKTRECRVWKTDDRTFHIVLMQGLNRQIRRMCGHFGYAVVKLKRIRIINVKLGNLPVGKYRQVTGEELQELIKGMVKNGGTEG